MIKVGNFTMEPKEKIYSFSKIREEIKLNFSKILFKLLVKLGPHSLYVPDYIYFLISLKKLFQRF